jgi:hypothetical protein
MKSRTAHGRNFAGILNGTITRQSDEVEDFYNHRGAEVTPGVMGVLPETLRVGEIRDRLQPSTVDSSEARPSISGGDYDKRLGDFCTC